MGDVNASNLIEWGCAGLKLNPFKLLLCFPASFDSGGTLEELTSLNHNYLKNLKTYNNINNRK